MGLIRMEHISKKYPIGGETVKALDDVSLEIGQGEFVAVVGPSGSGKSTLMHILGCLDVPDEGTYMLNGRAVSAMRGNQLAEIRNRSIGFVFQQFQLLPRLTAAANIELPLIYRGMAKKQRQALVTKNLELVGLKARAAFLPSELSGGQQQRVAIARALAGETQILLADEPTGSLDTKTGNEILEVLKTLHKQGRTIVLITHDKAIASHAGRMIRIQDGKITPAAE